MTGPKQAGISAGSTSQQELLSKPPHEAVFIDDPGQVVAYFQQLRPVPDAYRRYLPDASRVDRLPSYGGYGLLVLPVPLVSAEAGLTEQVQAAVQAAGPVWLAGMEEDRDRQPRVRCATLGYGVRRLRRRKPCRSRRDRPTCGRS